MTYTVDGLRCGSCVAEVIEELRGIPDVSGIAVRLVHDGASPLFVTSRRTVPPEVVRETVERVGFFRVLRPGRRRAEHLRRRFGPSTREGR